MVSPVSAFNKPLVISLCVTGRERDRWVYISQSAKWRTRVQRPREAHVDRPYRLTPAVKKLQWLIIIREQFNSSLTRVIYLRAACAAPRLKWETNEKSANSFHLFKDEYADPLRLLSV